MKLEELRARLKSPEAAAFVRKRIANVPNVKLPAEGIACGQAVSSAIVEFLGMQNEINPVYNDVDVFLPFSVYYLEHIKSMLSEGTGEESRVISTSVDGNLTSTLSGGYNYITQSVSENYAIEKSLSFGNLNKTYIFVPKILRFAKLNRLGYLHYSAQQVLSSFDINATQSALVLGDDSNELLFTPEFLLFLHTKELMIVNWNTPVHSLIRFGRKKLELGVYGNIEQMQHIAMSYASILGKVQEVSKGVKLEPAEIILNDTVTPNQMTPLHKSMTKIPLEFGTKQRDAFIDNQDLFKGLNVKKNENGMYSLESENPYSGKVIIDEYLDLGGDMIYGGTFANHDHDSLQEIVRTGEIPLGKIHHSRNGLAVNPIEEEYMEMEIKNPSLFMFRDYKRDMLTASRKFDANLASIYRLPKLLHGLKYSRKSAKNATRKLLKESFSADIESISLSSPVRDHIRDADVDPHSQSKFVEDMHKNTANDLSLFTKYEKILFKDGQHETVAKLVEKSVLSASDKGKVMEKIHQHAKNDLGIIGEIETEPTEFCGFGGMEGVLHDDSLARFSEWKIKEGSAPLLPDGLVRSHENEGYTCALLGTKNELSREGNDLLHCVGGYSQKISDGGTFIYSFVPKNKRGSRCTLEIELSKISRHFNKNKDKESLPAYRIAQIRGKRNKSITLDPQMMNIFKEINEHHPFLPFVEEKAQDFIQGTFSDTKKSLAVLNESIVFSGENPIIKSTLVDESFPSPVVPPEVFLDQGNPPF